MIIYKPHQVRSVGDPKVWRWTWRSSWPSLSCQSAKTRWGVSPRMNGQWPASIRSKIILPPVTCSDSKITIYQLSAFINGFFVGSMGWNFKTLEKKAGILDDEDIPRPKKVKSLGSKWIFSQGSWGDTLQGFIISWLQKWSLGMAFPSFLRPQNLEKLSLEELHQRKHDLKQEDQLRRARRFFSMRYKMYEATRCIYTVVCCTVITLRPLGTWDPAVLH